jgi:hypothetical protein|tara:strand:- start:1342 stop:1716 length:375 start_codon:yes stop_codon:yes gene_type:complete
MSMEPIQRLMSNNAAGVAGTPQLLNDQVTGLTFIQLNTPNTILDMFNSPDPAVGNTYQDVLQKNSISTGRTFFTTAMSTTSAGRAAVGPIRLASGQLQMESTLAVGGVAAANDNNLVIKFSNGF